MSSSREILPTISGSLISYLLSLFLVEYFSTYIYLFSYICPQISYLFITLFITLHVFFPLLSSIIIPLNSLLLFFCLFSIDSVFYTASTAFSILIIIFSLGSYSFFFLNAASSQIPVNLKK